MILAPHIGVMVSIDRLNLNVCKVVGIFKRNPEVNRALATVDTARGKYIMLARPSNHLHDPFDHRFSDMKRLNLSTLGLAFSSIVSRTVS